MLFKPGRKQVDNWLGQLEPFAPFAVFIEEGMDHFLLADGMGRAPEASERELIRASDLQLGQSGVRVGRDSNLHKLVALDDIDRHRLSLSGEQFTHRLIAVLAWNYRLQMGKPRGELHKQRF